MILPDWLRPCTKYEERYCSSHGLFGNGWLPEPRLRWEWRFEPRDLWIGAYWTLRAVSLHGEQRQRGGWDEFTTGSRTYLDIYVCVLPTLVLHVCWLWREELP